MPSTAVEDDVHVAVGVLACADAILIAQRPLASHHGGKWEFPGGKVAVGESVYNALVRELKEELGIDVQAAHPLIQVRYAYAERKVLLDVWRITRFQGEPRGREGQTVKWVGVEGLANVDFLEANRPILQAAQLPPLYVVSDARSLGFSEFLRRLERALAAGVRLLQLREPGLSAGDYEDLARHVVALCHRHGARVLLNAPPRLVATYGADGVHLSSQRLRKLGARPLSAKHWVAASTHNAEELALAERLGADFVVLSPVLATRSHPAAPAIGWERFSALCATTNLPVFALGGMQAQHLQAARSAGALGIAMKSGIWEAPHVDAVVAALTGM